MKIYGSKPPEGQDPTANAQKVAKTDAKTANVPAVKAGDKINISSKGKEISELMSVISQMPDIRTDKVDSVKKTIEAGNYKIDPAKIAGKILDEL